ncbi:MULTISPECIES: hypothetical protein [Priestia]|nr:hypothetical protein [Priestia megaterium]
MTPLLSSVEDFRFSRRSLHLALQSTARSSCTNPMFNMTTKNPNY